MTNKDNALIGVTDQLKSTANDFMRALADMYSDSTISGGGKITIDKSFNHLKLCLTSMPDIGAELENIGIDKVFVETVKNNAADFAIARQQLDDLKADRKVEIRLDELKQKMDDLTHCFEDARSKDSAHQEKIESLRVKFGAEFLRVESIINEYNNKLDQIHNDIVEKISRGYSDVNRAARNLNNSLIDELDNLKQEIRKLKDEKYISDSNKKTESAHSPAMSVIDKYEIITEKNGSDEKTDSIDKSTGYAKPVSKTVTCDHPTLKKFDKKQFEIDGNVLKKYKGKKEKVIRIPFGVTSIDMDAFRDCSRLTSIEIPNSVTSIGFNAFRDCSRLTSIEIPNSVTSIGFNAFYGCSRLTSIEIPNSVTSIDMYAFRDCSSLTSIVIPNSVTSIDMDAFRDCSSLTSIEIPNSVTSIEMYAFYGCSSLTSIVIPNSVTYIGISAFYGCSSLTSIVIPNSVTYIGISAFYGCSSLTSIVIPNSVTYIGSYAFGGCSSLTSIEIPNSVTSIGEYAFPNCSSLTSIVIPSSVTSIGSYAFYGCSSLESIEIPNSVTYIGSYAFSGCSSLESIEIPNSVTSIGSSAFSGCSSLSRVTVPKRLAKDLNSSILPQSCKIIYISI